MGNIMCKLITYNTKHQIHSFDFTVSSSTFITPVKVKLVTVRPLTLTLKIILLSNLWLMSLYQEIRGMV